MPRSFGRWLICCGATISSEYGKVILPLVQGRNKFDHHRVVPQLKNIGVQAVPF